MKTLEELKKEILQDGVIDTNEVKEIKEVIYADGEIDKEEADFLFDLNDAVSGKSNAKEWETLFVEAISSFVLDDEESNGEIDADEATYLVGKIQGDGEIDQAEKALLENLKKNSTNFPKQLEELL